MNQKRLTDDKIEQLLGAVEVGVGTAATAQALRSHIAALTDVPEDVARDREMVARVVILPGSHMDALSRLATAAARMPGLEADLKASQDALASALLRETDLERQRDDARQEVERVKETIRAAHTEVVAKQSLLEVAAQDAGRLQDENERLAARVEELERKHADECHHADTERNARREAEARATSAEARVKELETRKNDAYAERNQVVALLARMAQSLGWRVGVGQHPASDTTWEDDWRTILFIDLPMGQASWHFHDTERDLLAGLPEYPGTWDGHTTPQKYERVRAVRPTPAPAGLLEAVGRAVDGIVADLSDRRGLKSEWQQTATEVQRAIRKAAESMRERAELVLYEAAAQTRHPEQRDRLLALGHAIHAIPLESK